MKVYRIEHGNGDYWLINERDMRRIVDIYCPPLRWYERLILRVFGRGRRDA